MVTIDKSDTLPRAGETVLSCNHVALGDAASAHWYRYPEPIPATAPDGRSFAFRFMMACPECHAKIQRGVPTNALMAADRLWTDYDVLTTPEPKREES